MPFRQSRQASNGLGDSGDSQRKMHAKRPHMQARWPRHRRTNLAAQSERNIHQIISLRQSESALILCKVQSTGTRTNAIAPTAKERACISAKYAMPLRTRSISGSGIAAILTWIACLNGMTFITVVMRFERRGNAVTDVLKVFVMGVCLNAQCHVHKERLTAMLEIDTA